MIQILHEAEYCDLYLYSGLSPSGLHWRFEIGPIIDGSWPNNQYYVRSSIGKQGSLQWSEDARTAEILAENFVRYYALSKPEIDQNLSEYCTWYSSLLEMLGDHEVPIFYADHEAPHKSMLKHAPGYLHGSS